MCAAVPVLCVTPAHSTCLMSPPQSLGMPRGLCWGCSAGAERCSLLYRALLLPSVLGVSPWAVLGLCCSPLCPPPQEGGSGTGNQGNCFSFLLNSVVPPCSTSHHFPARETDSFLPFSLRTSERFLSLQLLEVSPGLCSGSSMQLPPPQTRPRDMGQPPQCCFLPLFPGSFQVRTISDPSLGNFLSPA